eukprot:9478123-Pyramimonas_sp.AAC.1
MAGRVTPRASPHAGFVSHCIGIDPRSQSHGGVGSHRIPLRAGRLVMLHDRWLIYSAAKCCLTVVQS